MLWIMALVFAAVIILMILRLPVGFAFGLGAIIMMWLFNVDPQWALPLSFKLILSFTFLALPLYLLVGTVAGQGGLAQRISDFIVNFLGRLKGGLGVALIVTNGIFGAISGAATSALAGIGKSFLGPAEAEGYPKNYTIALLICSAVLSIVIPPSGGMIIFGFMARMPISLCFLAPVGPGLVLIIFLSLTHMVMVQKIPSIHIPAPVSFKTYVKQSTVVTGKALPALLTPVLVLGGIYGGFITPTEAGGVAVIYSLIVGFVIYRALTPRNTFHGLAETGALIGSIIILFFFFIILSKILIAQRVSESILAAMLAISQNKWILLFMLNILMLIMGMIMDDASGIMISAIILLPVARLIGVDQYHFAAITSINLGMGLITPPVAPLLYLGGRIAGDLPLRTYFKPVLNYLIFAYLPTLFITVIYPPLSTTLPYAFMALVK